MKNITTVIFVFLTFISYGEDFFFNYKINDKYDVIVKANIKIYQDNKYLGLNSKEIKVTMRVKDIFENKYSISGDVYKMEKTLRNAVPAGYKVDKVERAEFYLFSNGNTISSNNFFPIFHNVPIFPDKKIEEGETFENEGRILADLGDTFENKILPTIVYSKYCGKSDLYGIKYDLFEVNCGYKTSYDKDVSKAAGLHKIRLYFDNEAGSPVFMDDHFTEEFLLSNGKKIKKSGFYLFFYKPIIKMDKDKIISDMTGDLVVENNEFYKDLDFRKKEEGVSITINNLRFKPDSTELIQEEKSKIDIIANLLKKIKNRSFLIVGHTALSGTTEERYNLSLERAKTVKDLLIERGIESQRLLYVGKGSEEPLFPNDSEENKQKNRRVEIIVLED